MSREEGVKEGDQVFDKTHEWEENIKRLLNNSLGAQQKPETESVADQLLLTVNVETVNK